MATRGMAPSFQQKQSNFFHLPVMAEEVVNYLLTNSSGIYVDATLGGGGHAERLLHSLDPHARLIGIDRDEMAINHVRKLSMNRDPRVSICHSPFSRLKDVLISMNIDRIGGILFDLGLASFQIDDPRRGFSYLQDGPLDMRMNIAEGATAGEIVNEYSEERLARVIREYGQERRWRRIAGTIVRERKRNSIERTSQLADIIRSVIPKQSAIKSLARVFQALRIEVNRELEELRRGLEAAVDLLETEGRLVVLCYQSLEDRVVKEIFQRRSGVCQCPKDLPHCICGARTELQILTKKALRPSAKELSQNPRARSARLRAARRLAQKIDADQNENKQIPA
jgi:16S rRNA (cytosine1402-N4)-methyltransferase